MASGKTSSFDWKLWMVIAVIVSTVASFTGGYLVGAANRPATIGIVDDYGRTVTLDGIPQRIVSVAPSPTEILFAVGAGPQVVGVDNMSDYPAEALDLPKVGDWNLNIEAIVSLKPDLIVSSDLVPRDQLNQLEAQGIPYFIFAVRTMEDVMKDLKLAGSLTGHSDEAQALVASLEARVSAVTNKTLAANVTKPMTYIEYYPLWTFGPGSYGDDVIRLAGGTNIAANASNEYPNLNSEFVIAQNPQVIIYTVGPWSTITASDYAERPGWSNIDAVAQGNIHSLDDNLISRYGPRVVDGLEELAEIIHPELFT